MDVCQLAAVQGRMAFGEVGRPTLQARYRGFSLHAATRVAEGRGDALERLCRHVLRPELDESRLAWSRYGKVVYWLERPWKDGTKLVVFELLVLIERLAALVPQPHGNLVTCHGAFAPAASHRERVVPVPPEDEGERPAFGSRQRWPCRAVRAKRERKPRRRRRSAWAESIRRSFGVDVLTCPQRGPARACTGGRVRDRPAPADLAADSVAVASCGGW